MTFNVCNIGKLICYTRSLSTIQGVCLEGSIVTYTLSDNFDYNRFIELYNVKNYRYTQGKITIVIGFGKICQLQTKIKFLFNY